MEPVMDTWSTAIALSAGAIYVYDRPDLIYSTYLNVFALAYFAVDLFHCQLINAIHHVCAGVLFYTFWDSCDAKSIVLALFICKIEISTIPFNMIQYVPESCKALTIAAFVITFIKFRVVDYYFFLQDPAVEFLLAESTLLRSSFYTLYAVNLYWFAVMIKTAWGERAQGAYYATLCQTVATYTYFGNIPIALGFPHPKRLGVYAYTAFTSFFYHNAVALNKPRRVWFILDSIAVHAVTMLNMSSAKNSAQLQTFSVLVNLGALAARLHIEAPEVAMMVSAIPFAVDCGVIMWSDAPQTLKLDYLLQVYLSFLVFYVNFLNEMSFICFHVVLWFNTVTVSKIGDLCL